MMKDCKKCNVCNKKLGLVAFSCKCEKFFCSTHLHFTEHACTFDYKTDGIKYLSDNSVKGLKEKLERI